MQCQGTISEAQEGLVEASDERVEMPINVISRNKSLGSAGKLTPPTPAADSLLFLWHSV